MPPGTLKIKTLTTLYKDHVSQDQKDEDGFWTATVTEEGRHCFRFHKDDPEPSYFEPAGGWKAALLPVFTNKLGMKFTSAKLLLEDPEAEFTEEQFHKTAKGSKTACQFWAKSQKKINGKMEEQATWKPVSKWTSYMVLGAPKKKKEKEEDPEEEEEEEEEKAASTEAEEEEAASTDMEEEEQQ
eukprot:g5556.t1